MCSMNSFGDGLNVRIIPDISGFFSSNEAYIGCASDLFHLISSKTILCVCVGLVGLCFVETGCALGDVSIWVV